MNLKEIFDNLNLGNLSIICFLALSLIEISPIKINPWSALAKWLRRELSLDTIEEDLMDSRRTRIIRFDDETVGQSVFTSALNDYCGKNCRTRPNPHALREQCHKPPEAGDSHHVERDADVERRAYGKLRGDRVQTICAVELLVLQGVDNVETTTPSKY